ncbi:HNH endonuclease signature motif containing protein [Plantibacter sp. ME-Dv--P-122b]|uniref:HNH endonuclease signature motif containing protein n=1 Tax=Plantibacter sp. ME-Dv--P-122b TaxID=3040300 RepID=UPI00330577A6
MAPRFRAARRRCQDRGGGGRRRSRAPARRARRHRGPHPGHRPDDGPGTVHPRRHRRTRGTRRLRPDRPPHRRPTRRHGAVDDPHPHPTGTGAVVSVGREQYRVPADLARAVRLRDTTCRAPGCGRAARSCDLDHSVAWQDGGTTAVDNLACLCRHHHRLKHLPGWNLEHRPGGILTWTTPDGRRHETRPELAETG